MYRNLLVCCLVLVTINWTEAEIHSCERICDGIPQTCVYDFHVEWFLTLSKACFKCPDVPEDCLKPDCIAADGFPRLVQVVNRTMPGPRIDVCQGDEILVRVHNDMPTESTTMHWHGQHCTTTPYMDGVPMLTQCPIQPMNSFTYTFRAQQHGTHIWHSHSGVQRSNGVYGALIVRQLDKDNVHVDLYDHDLPEHTILLSDWTQSDGQFSFLQTYHTNTRIGKDPRSILVNGLGRFTNVDGETPKIPAPRFTVEKGKRYRFRIISSAHMTVPIAVSFDNHKIKVISTDGRDVKPVDVDKLTISNGERFDIVLEANQIGTKHWILFEGLVNAFSSKAYQAAVLQYSELGINDYPDGIPTYESSHREGKDVNAVNAKPNDPSDNNVAINELEAVDIMNEKLAGIPDKKLWMTFDMKPVDFPLFQHFNPSTEKLPQTTAPHINHIVLHGAPFPLLSQRDQVTSDMFCNRNTIDPKCANEFCACPHVEAIKLGDMVEMIMVDEGQLRNSAHPMHLHGYHFRVVANGKLGDKTTEEEVRQLDKDGKIVRNLVDAPWKDTVVVPDGGYTVIRFIADSPGYWILHCHIDFHVELGMGFILKVGEHSEMPPVPEAFPTCGHYTNPPTRDAAASIIPAHSVITLTGLLAFIKIAIG